MGRIDAASVQGLRQLHLTGLRTHPAPGAPPSGRHADTVAVAGATAGSLSEAQQRLERLDLLLSELKHLTSRQDDPRGVADRQRQIDTLVASIDQAAAEVAMRRGFEHIALTQVSPEVAFSDITEANLAPGESLDLEIVVRQSAHQGALFLSMGAGTIDLGGATSSFILEISGSLGSKTIQFSSSMSLVNIANAINAQAGDTGIQAMASATGIALRSASFGSNDFTSVRVLDDGGIEGPETLGIYAMLEDDTDTADRSTAVAFDSLQALEGLKDHGQDIVAAVDGEPVYGRGATLTFATARVAGTIELATGELTDPRGANAQNLGPLHAMTISVLKTADDHGELATAPPDVLHDRVSTRLAFLESLQHAGVSHLPPSLGPWVGADGASLDAPSVQELAQGTRQSLLTGAPLNTAHDPHRVFELLR